MFGYFIANVYTTYRHFRQLDVTTDHYFCLAIIWRYVYGLAEYAVNFLHGLRQFFVCHHPVELGGGGYVRVTHQLTGGFQRNATTAEDGTVCSPARMELAVLNT